MKSLLTLLTEDWKQEASCRTTTTNPETDFWFPDPSDSKEVFDSKKRIAKVICAACLVRDDCLAYAIQANEPFGIWGGKTKRERTHIRKQWVAQGLLESDPRDDEHS